MLSYRIKEINMKHKKLSFSVKEDHIRGVAATVVSQVMTDLAVNHKKNMDILNNQLATGSAEDVLKCLEDIVEVFSGAITEVERTADLVEHIPEMEKEEPEDSKKK